MTEKPTEWQERYIRWLEQIVLMNPPNICGQMLKECGEWCRRNCDMDAMHPKCLRSAFTAGIKIRGIDE